MEYGCSLPSSQQSSTGYDAEPVESTSRILSIHFNIALLPTAGSPTKQFLPFLFSDRSYAVQLNLLHEI
jgi:hypothetical protein